MSKRWSVYFDHTNYWPPEWASYHWIVRADTAMDVIRSVEKCHFWTGDVTKITQDGEFYFISGCMWNHARIEPCLFEPDDRHPEAVLPSTPAAPATPTPAVPAGPVEG